MSTIAEPKRISIPVVRTRSWKVPPFMSKLHSRKWADSAFFWDIDKTVLGSSDAEVPDRLAGRMLYEFGRSLERGARHAFVTGAHFRLQEKRAIDPLREHLRARGNLSLMRNVALAANRGGALCVYNERGELDTETFEAHQETYGIAPEDLQLESLQQYIFDIDRKGNPITLTGKFEDGNIIVTLENASAILSRENLSPLLRAILEAVKEYLEDYAKNAEDYHKRFPKIDFSIPIRIELRGLIQLGIKSFPGIDKIEELISKIQSKLSDLSPEVAGKYSFVPGGGTTIDINRKGVGKPLAVSIIGREHFTLPWPEGSIPIEEIENGRRTPVFGVGDEFWVKSHRNGKPLVGGDTTMLEVPHLVGLAVNPDQATVDSLRSLGMGGKATRIVPLGSGPDASRELLIWSNREEPATEITVPVEEKVDLAIPASLLEFLSQAREEGVIALSGNFLKGPKYGKGPQSVFPQDVVEVVKLLKRGIPVVIVTGGDYEERVLPIFEALKQAAAKEVGNVSSILRNMLFYSNGGAVKVGFNPFDGKPLFDEEFNRRYRIPTDDGDYEKLERLLSELAQEYTADSSLMGRHEVEFPEAPPQVERRYADSQLSLRPTLPSERGRLLFEFKKRMGKLGLKGEYADHLGGNAIDVTHAEVSKASALDDAAAYFGRSKFIFIGGELAFMYDEQSGQILPKIDMEIFSTRTARTAKVVHAVAINYDQRTAPDHPLITPGGSGLPALGAWLSRFNQILDGKA